ncbi:hypothetical protein [Haladaptatus halobius]|uniref:hypothetical protein n=1 Tax=Haladaptatus halobius TaxID=2884875 RepID=UPI001D09F908|nr:hypothetical protein [Haladaptatus halobius]
MSDSRKIYVNAVSERPVGARFRRWTTERPKGAKESVGEVVAVAVRMRFLVDEGRVSEANEGFTHGP